MYLTCGDTLEALADPAWVQEGRQGLLAGPSHHWVQGDQPHPASGVRGEWMSAALAFIFVFVFLNSTNR